MGILIELAALLVASALLVGLADYEGRRAARRAVQRNGDE